MSARGRQGGVVQGSSGTSRRGNKWRESLNKSDAEESESRSDANEGRGSAASGSHRASSDGGRIITVPSGRLSATARPVPSRASSSNASPKNGAAALNMDGQADPAAASSDSDRVSKRSLVSILLEAAFFFLMGDALREDDTEAQKMRKITIVSAFTVMVFVAPLELIFGGIAVRQTSGQLLIAHALVAFALSFGFHVLMRKYREVNDLMYALHMYSTGILALPLFELAGPGLGVFPVLGWAATSMSQAPPHGGMQLVIAFILSAVSVYNIVAPRFASQPVGFPSDSLTLNVGMTIEAIAYATMILMSGPFSRNVAKQVELKRATADALVFEACKAMERFDEVTLDQLRTQAQDGANTVATASQARVIAAMHETVARYRPHVPHYVLDAAVMANVGNVETASIASPAVDELRSQRHHRRTDLRNPNAGRSGTDGLGNSGTWEVASGSARMSRYASAASDVASARSKRSDRGAGASGALQASPLYLARTRPIVHRKVTVAHLEIYVPTELATPRTFALLVDEFLSRASEFEASVHTLVGDVAVVSWNAVKSIANSELLACRYSAELVRFVRRKLLPLGSASVSQRGRAAISGADFSLSAAPSQPRVTGAVMSGEARVCFAGSTTYEFCLSYPTWQPVVVELRKIASTRNMICIDAQTRSSAGHRIKARAVDAVAVMRRTGNLSRYGTVGAAGSSLADPIEQVTMPLVELARSPARGPGLGDSGQLGGDSGSPGEDMAFDLVVYELVEVLVGGPVSGRASNNSMSLGASGGPGGGGGGPSGAGIGPIDIGDEDDDDGLGLALGIGRVSSPSSRHLPSPSMMMNRHGPGGMPRVGPGGSGGASTTFGSITPNAEDYDEALTKGVHLAAMERRFAEAARKFRDAIDAISARIAERAAAAAAAAHAAVPAADPTLAPSGPPDLGTMFKGHEFTDSSNELVNPTGDDAVDDDDLTADRVVSAMSLEALLHLAAGLQRRAVKCMETNARTFSNVLVTTQVN